MKVERISHVTINVEDLEAARNFWGDLLDIAFSESRDINQMDTKVSICQFPRGGAIELTAPLTPDGAYSKSFEHRGPGLNLLSLMVDDFDQAVAHIKSRGVRLLGVIERPKQNYAIFHPRDTGGVTLEVTGLNK